MKADYIFLQVRSLKYVSSVEKRGNDLLNIFAKWTLSSKIVHVKLTKEKIKD